MVTTISVSEDTKEKIRNLGRAGDSYDDILRRMYEVTKRQILLHYLYDTSDSISIDEARKEHAKRWRT